MVAMVSPFAVKVTVPPLTVFPSSEVRVAVNVTLSPKSALRVFPPM